MDFESLQIFDTVINNDFRIKLKYNLYIKILLNLKDVHMLQTYTIKYFNIFIVSVGVIDDVTPLKLIT